MNATITQEPQLKLDEREETMLIEQIKYLQNELVSIQQAFLSAISIPVGIYVLAIYYAYSSEYSDTMFAVLPFFFSLSMFNILKYSIKMLGLDAYIRHMEGVINRVHKKSLFLWQSKLIYANSYSVVGGVCQIPVFIAIAIFLGAKFVQAVQVLDTELFPYAAGIFTALLISEVVFLIIILLICLTQYHAVDQWCKDIPFELTPENEGELKSLHTGVPHYIPKSMCSTLLKCSSNIIGFIRGIKNKRGV